MVASLRVPVPGKSLVVRTDASVTIGTGHVMRCLALAQAWQDAGGRVVFAMAETTGAVRARLGSESVEVVSIEAQSASARDAGQVGEVARMGKADWVVLDGHFSVGYQSELKSSGLKLLYLSDDRSSERCVADVILNQNSDATGDMYAEREAYTRLLLGTRYVLLRREFLAWSRYKRDIASARALLVTMGGSDPDNLTNLALEALSMVRTEGLQATVVAGGSNPHFDSLQATRTGAGATIQLHRSVPNMPELMAAADLAVIAAGGTLWELLYMSCPVLSFARNVVQRHVLEDLDRGGIVQYLGDPRQFEPAGLAAAIDALAASLKRRERMAAQGRQQVDGEGARRVCQLLAGLN